MKQQQRNGGRSMLCKTFLIKTSQRKIRILGARQKAFPHESTQSVNRLKTLKKNLATEKAC